MNPQALAALISTALFFVTLAVILKIGGVPPHVIGGFCMVVALISLACHFAGIFIVNRARARKPPEPPAPA